MPRIPDRSRTALVFVALAFFAGCASPPPPEAADELTVGKVQGHIKEGMAAASVAEVLGSPNIITTDEERREVWIYDKISSDRVASGSSFGGGIIILGGGTGRSSSSTTQRTLTIIIKYDHDMRVRDFAYNYSQF